ncbi:hypothetical protein CONPUDRAFT_157446 [Coniophora puteana RWD-64-598 SS2]|uniref:C2H2-type domain-containing protein n=1 Tax=Coniophora puteana (strain RWD-64-598) TaxID=741705 RepID=A0A5M3MF01_CONPW|nr:uncharacterized protein CONPUDRAFT_157446 [Coniophora puteana RWD-64-598 SS2]EIW77185.1 hypothetical protein CONPUDRAFT_157446 [Coniophora puteana RWD-64-598 SS2]
MSAPNEFRVPTVPCPHCPRKCLSAAGLLRHVNVQHRSISEDIPDPNLPQSRPHPTATFISHPHLNARKTSASGAFLFDGDSPPPPPTAPPAHTPEAWAPFQSRVEFDFVFDHYVKVESSASDIRSSLDFWDAVLAPHGDAAPWRNEKELYETIDQIPDGDIPWKVYKLKYNGPLPRSPPKWMTETYELCTRDSRAVLHHQLATREFRDKINYSPYRHFNDDGKRVFSNLMSGEWAWRQADALAEDPQNHGAMFVPVVAGSDKTTVSVATGHQEFHPVYVSPGNLTNTARRGHSNSVLPVAFLPIPRTKRRHRNKPEFRTFCRQLYHAALRRVFKPLEAVMETPEVVKCPDGHFRWAVYGLGPYIADYPEQVWLSGIVQGWCPKCNAKPHALDDPGARRRTREKTDTYCSRLPTSILWDDYGIRDDYRPFMHHFPRADIHELLSPDLLHQVIKGTFKDHVVAWVNTYLKAVHGETQGGAIIDEIDRSLVPPFPGLRRFPDGRDFEQWTGDDSKALMKVYLPAIAGFVPTDMVQCLSAFLDFCYIARQNSLSAEDLDNLDDALARFHRLRDVFIRAGVRPNGISLPRQHSLCHYRHSIVLFGSPNGLCSSITESKHIVAVKKPWRRSSRFKALHQMLLILVRLDKLHAARRSFEERGMMFGTTSGYQRLLLSGNTPLPPTVRLNASVDAEEEDHAPSTGPKVLSSIELSRTREQARLYPRDPHALAGVIGQPRLPDLIQRFLFDQSNPDHDHTSHPIAIKDCPDALGPIYVHHSAIARFWAPSDFCGAGGMHREWIRCNPAWRNQYARHDTVLIEVDGEQPGMRGMMVGRVYLFFSYEYDGTTFPCALIHWFTTIGDRPDPTTGMWVVRPEYLGNQAHMAVVHLDSISRAVHLIPTYGTASLPEDLEFYDSLDAFRTFYVNRWVDHHMHSFMYGDG